ncbi:uncharacterized protein LOC132636099 [Lycium barbarum]|uniref:uncharacterized protein LOC132636099 n=1 Tax=Lycium barbarum TaxID=112863 RepID=UPI00293ECD4B|nr:uncharacterized protein LOC132636099 [Lycium barbarum]
MEKKKQRDKKWSCEKRSPLQDLNAIPRCNSKISNVSNSSSFSSSSSSSSSRNYLQKKPKISSRISNPMPKSTHLRSKSTNENDLPNPTSQKPKKNLPFPSEKKTTSQKSNLLSHMRHPVKKSAFGLGRNGSGDLHSSNLTSLENCTNNNNIPSVIAEVGSMESRMYNFENCTPVGKLACATLDGTCNNGERSNTTSDSNNTTKTPPIEASVSPEIQCGGLVSAATTPCYAAGHVLSGVTDKRKCRPRGVLTIGIDSLEYTTKCRSSSRASLIPLPALASMHWLNDIYEGEPVNEFRTLMTRSPMSELPYSTSTCSGSTSNSVHNIEKYSDSVNRDVCVPELKDPSCDEMRRNLFLSSPLGISCCHDVKVVADEWKCSCSIVRENSPCSTASLSSGNVIQTPKSDMSSGKCGGFSWLHSGDRGDNLGDELDSVADFLEKTSLSPTTEPSASDPPNQHFKFTSDSWVSDSTLDNVSQSQMRISWRDGIVTSIFEIDDLDCCRCLSDDENGGYCYTYAKTNVGFEENDLLPETGSQSPDFLEHKHELSQNGKLKSALVEANTCAESIRTEGGGGLVSSADSDWTPSYKNQLYQV